MKADRKDRTDIRVNSFPRRLLAWTLAVFLTFPDCCGAFSLQNQRTLVIIYHKPPDVVTTHATNDVKGRMNVYDDIRTMRGYVGESSAGSLEELTGYQTWNAIGRLDAETTGLLLVTNDGGLVHHVTNKNARTNEVPIGKTYQAQIMGYYDEESTLITELRTNGVDIGAKYGGHTCPIPDLKILGHPSPKTTVVSLTLYEGKNRQVRRMFHSLGSGVMRLKRTAVGGNLTLYGLEKGQWRILSDEEVVSGLNWKPQRLWDQTSDRRPEGADRKKQRRRRKSRF